MATVIQPRLNGLARRLVTDGYLSENVAISAQETAQKKRVSLVNYLLNERLVSPRDMMLSGSAEFGMPALDLSAFNTEHIPTKLINERLVRMHGALPLYSRDNRLYVAIADPTNLSGLDGIKFNTG